MKIFNLFSEETQREFDFVILVVTACIILRSYFRGEKLLNMNSDLLFEITLLMIPVTIFLVKHKTNAEIVEFYKVRRTIFHLIFSIIFVIIGRSILKLDFGIPINYVLMAIGVALTISGIINILFIALSTFIYLQNKGKKDIQES